MLANLKNIFKVPDLRNKILFTFLCVAVYRLGAAIVKNGQWDVYRVIDKP